MHSWYDESDLDQNGIDKTRRYRIAKGAHLRAVELFKPVRHVFEKPKRFYNPRVQLPPASLNRAKACSHNCDETYAREQEVHNTHSMFYSIMKCNELCQMYSHENNIQYDAVIRIRFDVLTSQELKITSDKYDLGCLHYINIHQPDNIVSDWINFGNPSVMNCYSSVFNFLEYLNTYRYFHKEQRKPNTVFPSNTSSWGNEHMIRDLMQLFHIPTICVHDIQMNLCYG